MQATDTLTKVMKKLLLSLAVAAAACTDATGPQISTPDKLVFVGSTALSGEPGFVLPDSVRVRLVDARGNGMAGEHIAFAVTDGGGSVMPADAVTDNNGVAAAEWRLGPQPGANALRASHDNRAVTVQATARESAGKNILKISGGSTSALVPAGCTLSDQLVVKVTDSQGNPVAGASVGFEGAGTVTPDVVTTGADGIARGTWQVGYEGGVNTMRAVLRTAAHPSVEFTANATAAAPGGYSVIGNKIFEPGTCKSILFHGATRPALQWWPTGDDRYVSSIAEDMKNIKSWGANVVRIPITQTFWVAGNKQYDPTYKARVIDAVTKARAAGLAVIVDDHASDRGNTAYDKTPDGQQMPDVNISVPFWKDVAATFKNDGGVIFELYNEPHEITWDVWLNGGDIASGPTYPGGPFGEGYKAVGMQQLYDAVRGVGARNLVLVSGMHWGYYLDQVPQHRVKGYNIVYGAHPYDWPDKQPDVWERDFGVLAATDPVMISEFGAYDCSRLWYYNAALDYADKKGMSWVAWAWWTPPPVSGTYSADQRNTDICHFPALITDWNATPSPSGAIIKSRLATYH